MKTSIEKFNRKARKPFWGGGGWGPLALLLMPIRLGEKKENKKPGGRGGRGAPWVFFFPPEKKGPKKKDYRQPNKWAPTWDPGGRDEKTRGVPPPGGEIKTKKGYF